MSWRTVVVKNRCKLSFRNDYMIVFGEKVEKTIHISEIGRLIIENTATTLTSYLLYELSRAKVKIIFCDHQKNPYSEMVPYFGAHNSSKQFRLQGEWSEDFKAEIWQKIVQQKISKQARVLKICYPEKEKEVESLLKFESQVLPLDKTNREAHAAKLYFKAMFGADFSRDEPGNTNAGLNYGYTILLSSFNREISSAGYSTAIGVFHCNEYNPFNLSSDLMESFRPLVDKTVFELRSFAFDDFYKQQLIEILNSEVNFAGKKQYMSNAISLYVQNFFRCSEDKSNKLEGYEI